MSVKAKYDGSMWLLFVEVLWQEQYYRVNTDLAIETVARAKACGVHQFVFMSSMIVYGDKSAVGVDAMTLPSLANFYGDSKWQTDKGIRAMVTEGLKVAVLRLSMTYGRGSKGNYSTLAKIAKAAPFFPAVTNKCSMLYIDNLCEFISLLVLSGSGGVYVLQNKEYSNTGELVKLIASAIGRRIWISKVLSSAVTVGELVPGKIGDLVNKAFGSSYYDQKLSTYEGLEYCKVSLEESIRRTEHTPKAKETVNKQKIF